MRCKTLKLFAMLAALALLASACVATPGNMPTDPSEGEDTTMHDPTAADPVPTDPNPTEPESTDPNPTEPTTTEPVSTNPVPSDPPAAEPEGYKVSPLQYPADAVKTLAGRMISLGSFRARGAGETSYKGNRHYTGTNLVISPYFSATVDDAQLPVYATPVYVATGNHGALHSYASVDVNFGDHDAVVIKIAVSDDISVKSAQVFAHDEATLTQTGGLLTLTVHTHGTYTVVLNDDQDYAVTVFVRSYRNELAEIAEFKALYGADKVMVFEPGIHAIDYLLMLQDDMVLYLKAGAILLPKHTIDIMSDEAAANESEFCAREANGIGLNRYPVINGYNAENLTIAGRGTVDMTQLDWHERRGIVFTLCENVSMDGVILINPCEWSFITYRCENVTVTQTAVLGYRTNSDAFAICNSIDVTVTDCFARTGDDMFEVKTLGGVETAVSRDITYRRCQAWGSKARCFGVIGEIEKNVSNVLFEDGIVIFRDAIWDNNRIGSLIVLRETGSGNVDGVTFRNIQIHHDAGRAINVGVYNNDLTEGAMRNIVFENVTYHANMNAQLRKNRCGHFTVTMKNVTANGVAVNARNHEDYFYCDSDNMLAFKN